MSRWEHPPGCASSRTNAGCGRLNRIAVTVLPLDALVTTGRLVGGVAAAIDDWDSPVGCSPGAGGVDQRRRTGMTMSDDRSDALGRLLEDGDALLVTVDQVGAACHTGERTCFDADQLDVVVTEAS